MNSMVFFQLNFSSTLQSGKFSKFWHILKLLGIKDDEILLASGKTGQGVKNVPDAVIKQVPAPSSAGKKTQALIFDSLYDDYRGVVMYVRVMAGQIKKGDTIVVIGFGGGLTFAGAVLKW